MHASQVKTTARFGAAGTVRVCLTLVATSSFAALMISNGHQPVPLVGHPTLDHVVEAHRHRIERVLTVRESGQSGRNAGLTAQREGGAHGVAPGDLVVGGH